MSTATGMPGSRREALHDDIAQARDELSRTLQELMVRADVRSRARASATVAADRMRATLRTPTPWLALAAGTATVVLLARLDRWRQRSSGWERPGRWSGAPHGRWPATPHGRRSGWGWHG